MRKTKVGNVLVLLLAASPVQCVGLARPKTNECDSKMAVPAGGEAQWPDDREIVDRLGPNLQFNDVGVIEPDVPITLKESDGTKRTGKFAGTAALINPCQLLANYHEVFGDMSVEPYDVSKYGVKFRVGALPSGRGFANIVHGNAIYAGEYNGEDHAQDFVIINLDECPGSDKIIGYHDMAAIDPASLVGLSVIEVGYPNDLVGNDPSSMALSLQRCKVVGYDGPTTNLLTKCRTNRGGSGSMLLAENNGKLYVVGVAASGYAACARNGGIAGYLSTAVPVTHMKRWIDAHYSVDFAGQVFAYDRKYGPPMRPQSP